MATFAIPIDHPAPNAKSSLPRRISDPHFATLLVTALTALALLIHGYHPYAEDGGLYLAGVERLLDPTLFPHSTNFVLEPTRFSRFAPTLAAIVRTTHLALPQVLLTIHLTSIWTTLFAAWMLATRCWTTRTARAGAVVLLACWLTLPVAGTALVLMDPYLTGRSFSTPCMMLALVAALDATSAHTRRMQQRSLLYCIAVLAFASAMHPLMAAYAIAASAILLCVRSPRPHIRRAATVIFSIAIVAAATILQATANPETPDYKRIALTRTYWFPTHWSWYELIGLAAPLAILAVVATRRTAAQHIPPQHIPPQPIPPAPRALAQMALISGATALLVAILFAHPTSSTHLIARLQPLRVFQIVYLVMVLTLGARFGESILKHSPSRWATATLLLASPMFLATRHAFPNTPHLELPCTTSPNPWAQSFLWISQHTPKDALFALDPDYINSPHEDAQCFRAIAQRSSLPDYSKDGGEASIAPDLTPAWTAGQQAQQALNTPTTTDASRVAALTPLGVTWLILNAHTATHFTCPYTNEAVKVCLLP